MFLAINEIKHSKLRYFLVTGVMFLIAYLVFFLTGLAYGLAQEYRMAIDKWGADDIIITDSSNDNLNMSMIDEKVFDSVKADKKAVLAQTAGVISKNNGKENVDVSFFGIDAKQFLAPNIIEGKMFSGTNEAVANISLKDDYNMKIGDKLKISGNSNELKIVGFTDDARYATSPVLYVSIDTFQKIRFDKEESTDDMKISAILTKGSVSNLPSDLKKVKISEFIKDLPGYNAQVLTFSFMIGFLIVIAAVVIGIFVYVLTMQKTDIFGVMKAQGISSGFIAKSVIAQTFILAAVGVNVGLLATIGTSLALPSAVPFQVNVLFFVALDLLMIFFAILGAFFSVRAIVKIDPLKAIG